MLLLGRRLFWPLPYSISIWSTSYMFSNTLFSFITPMIHIEIWVIICLIYHLIPQNFKFRDKRDHICLIHCYKADTHHSARGRSSVNTCWRNDRVLPWWENGRILCLSLEHSTISEIMQSGEHLQSPSFDQWFTNMTWMFYWKYKHLGFIFKRFDFNIVRSEQAISLPADSGTLGHSPVFRNYCLRHCPEMTVRITVQFAACSLCGSLVLFALWCNCEGEVEGFLWRRNTLLCTPALER